MGLCYLLGVVPYLFPITITISNVVLVSHSRGASKNSLCLKRLTMVSGVGSFQRYLPFFCYNSLTLFPFEPQVWYLGDECIVLNLGPHRFVVIFVACPTDCGFFCASFPYTVIQVTLPPHQCMGSHYGGASSSGVYPLQLFAWE